MDYVEEGCTCPWCCERRGGVSVPEDAQEETVIVEAEIELGITFPVGEVVFSVGGTDVIALVPVDGETAAEFVMRLHNTSETIEATIDAVNALEEGEQR
jgi:hypothetical protein